MSRPPRRPRGTNASVLAPPLVFIGHRTAFARSRERFLMMGCAMPEDSGAGEVEALKDELEDLKALVNTLLTIIMEEADGVQSGAAPSIPDQPKRGYCM